MEPWRLVLMAVLAVAVLSCCCRVVQARPHGNSPLTVNELTDMASNMAHTLDEVVDMLSTQRSRSRRRRMVHFHIGRNHHHSRHRFRRGPRRLRYRKQRASRNPDISDH
ncbi:hypothetical protein ACOMHN_015469 [Nucella lapillus]